MIASVAGARCDEKNRQKTTGQHLFTAFYPIFYVSEFRKKELSICFSILTIKEFYYLIIPPLVITSGEYDVL